MTDQRDSPRRSQPSLKRPGRWLISLAGVLLLLAILNAALRPWYMRWGATDAELRRTYPDNQLVPNVLTVATRAITIQAPPQAVWPWIVQIGEDRGGFYSYTWLENLFLADMHNADRINPQWQTRQRGDTVWLTRKGRYRGNARTVVAEYEPGHVMILVSPPNYEKLAQSGPPIDATWSVMLEPEGENASRLIMRWRGQSTGWVRQASGYFLFDPCHFIMERRMMLGIKERAEKSSNRR